MRKIGFTAFIGWAVSAALLIAGCVPPPPPPDPNLSKMLDPQKQELVNMRAEYKKAKEDLTKARADLDSRLKSLCRGEAPLILTDVGHNPDFQKKIKAVFAKYEHKDAKYGPLDISATFTDIAEKGYSDLIKLIRKEATDSKPQVVLALDDDHPPKCVAEPGSVAGASTGTKAVSTPRVLLRLEVRDLVGQPEVWIKPEKNHWLNELDVVKNGRIEIEGKLPRAGWTKTETGWAVTIQGPLPPHLEIKHDREEGQFIGTDGSPLGTLLYVMAARQALGGVVEYRKFGVTDPVQSPPDEQIRLVDATLQPACPPPGKNKINDNSVVKSFKDQLKAFLKTACRN